MLLDNGQEQESARPGRPQRKFCERISCGYRCGSDEDGISVAYLTMYQHPTYIRLLSYSPSLVTDGQEYAHSKCRVERFSVENECRQHPAADTTYGNALLLQGRAVTEKPCHHGRWIPGSF